VKLLFTALLIVVVGYGIVQFAQASYGWFQMSGVVDDHAANEIPRIIERIQQAGGLWETGGDRYVKMREGIVKGAQDAGVPLQKESVAIGIVDNMLDVRLSWEAPLVVYQGKSYVELPMTVQRRFALTRARGY
jgi:hypothetical protein